MSAPFTTNEALGSWLDVKAANLTFACHPRDVCCPECEPHYAEADRFREAAARLRSCQAVIDMADTLELQGETMISMERVMALVAPLRGEKP